MVMASNYQIKEERKTVSIIFQRMFKYTVNENEVHVDLEEALYWFAKLQVAKLNQENPSDQNMSRTVVLCMTSDGFRSG
jgi:hypothetical protein